MQIRSIPGWEMYQISESGDIYRNGNKLKLKTDRDGYLVIALSNNGLKKHFSVHRLVALVFLGPSDLQVNHLDGNKKNNHYLNLEYVTCSENIKHAFRIGLKSHVGEKNTQSVLTESLVLELRKTYEVEKNISKISRRYNVNRRTISDVVRNKTWRHI